MSASGIGHDNCRNVYQDRHTYLWDSNADNAALRDDPHHIIDSKA
ncbi:MULTISPECIES: hypothetical protein [Streptomyces]